MNICHSFKVLLAFTLAHEACAHGAVTRPLPRRSLDHPWCAWCVGERQPVQNPYGQVHHETRPSSPCLGTVRGDEPYAPRHFGQRYRSIAEAGPATYMPGQSFEANVLLSADHAGEAQWQFCPHSQAETEECFQQHRISEWVDVHSYWDPNNQMSGWKSGEHFPQTVTLSGVPVGNATLRWLWVCKYTTEVFVSCIDVTIASGGPTPTSVPTSSPVPTQVPTGPVPTPAPSTTSAPGPCSALWGQCGGITWSGPTCCDAGLVCFLSNPHYSQCREGTEPTPTPTLAPTPAPRPTPVPTLAPPEPTCELEAQLKDCILHGGAFECNSCGGEIEVMPCCSCHALEETTTTETATSASRTTTTITAPSCKPWCAGKAENWEKKCRWAACSGCLECARRRLQASDSLLA